MDETRLNEIIKLKRESEDSDRQESRIIKEYLVAESGGMLRAVQIEYLLEVFDIKDPGDIVPIPFTPGHILGIINLRGEIVPVVSIERILGRRENPVLKKMVVVEENGKIAFPVADIVDLVPVDIKEIRAVKAVVTGGQESFLSGEFDLAGRQVLVLDILRMVHSEFFQ